MPDDAFDDDPGFHDPLPLEDRLWRHPSEVGGLVQAARRRREVTNGKLIGLGAAASLLGSALTVGALGLGGAFDRPAPAPAPVERTITVPVPALAGQEGAKWPAVVASLTDSLARLEVNRGGERPVGSAVAFRNTSDGTYFVTSRDLIINADRVNVVLNGDRTRRAEVVGHDPYTNLAVVRVDAVHHNPPTLHDSGEVSVGSEAVVMGGPAPETSVPSVAKALVGSISSAVTTRGGGRVEGLLRTDANVSADAKGGALVDDNGTMIGLMVAMGQDDAGVERFGYALPASLVKATADSLIDLGFPARVWFGIGGEDVVGGALVTSVAVGSPAEACKLSAGDTVVRLNGTDVGTMSRLVMTLRKFNVTDDLVVEFVRDGEARLCVTTLARPPGSGDPIDGNQTTTTATTTTATTTAIAGTTPAAPPPPTAALTPGPATPTTAAP